MSKVERIEISQGDVTIENYISSTAEVRIARADPDTKDTVFKITDLQAQALFAVLDVYLKSRDS